MRAVQRAISSFDLDAMRDLIEEMQVYYARRAPIYDASMGYDDPARVAALAPVISAIQGELRDRDVLEVACGPAFWTSWLSQAARRIVAMDYNEPMLHEARRKDFSPKAVVFVAGDAYELPFANGGFDGAFAGDWLAHVPMSRMRGFLENLHTKLRRSAKVVFCDQLPGPHSIESTDAEGNHMQQRELPDGSKYRVIKHFLTDHQMTSIFSEYARGGVEIKKYPGLRRVVVSYSLQ